MTSVAPPAITPIAITPPPTGAPSADRTTVTARGATLSGQGAREDAGRRAALANPIPSREDTDREDAGAPVLPGGEPLRLIGQELSVDGDQGPPGPLIQGGAFTLAVALGLEAQQGGAPALPGDQPVTQADPTAAASTEQAEDGEGPDGLTEEEQKVVRELQARDAEVRRHEAAHAAAGGQYAGSPSYTFQRGPDGRQYAVGGAVPIDVSPVDGDPEATIRKAEQVRRAALAPADPSGADRAIASQANALAAAARAELAAERSAETREAAAGGDEASGNETPDGAEENAANQASQPLDNQDNSAPAASGSLPGAQAGEGDDPFALAGTALGDGQIGGTRSGNDGAFGIASGTDNDEGGPFAVTPREDEASSFAPPSAPRGLGGAVAPPPPPQILSIAV